MDVHREDLNPDDRDEWRWKLNAWSTVALNLWWLPLLLVACAVLLVKSLA